MHEKGRLRIVDDDQNFAELTRRRFTHLGFTVDFHCGGFGVTQKLLESRYDLLLIDFNMPGLAIDELGRRVEALIQARTPAAPAG